ncbi:MAG: hypothetical protein QNJ27_05000 [Simkaniaceae bacterium]|nr:hypothetical protein [Simkaniaceae bacterium]
MTGQDTKRLLFGFEVYAPRPESLPDEKTLKAKKRHLTLLFFENISYEKIYDHIRFMPKPFFRVGPVAIADSSLRLPNRSPDILTWHVEAFGDDLIDEYQRRIHDYFEEKGYVVERKKFIKHITLGRSASLVKEAKKNFRPLPLYFSNFHLYEKHPGEHYEPIWTYDLLLPFEEKKKGHFILRGGSFQQLFLNAQIALAFTCPALVPFLDQSYVVRNLQDGEVRLTTLINQAYKAVKVPIKKAIFPDKGQEEKGLLSWDLFVE